MYLAILGYGLALFVTAAILIASKVRCETDLLWCQESESRGHWLRDAEVNPQEIE